MPPIRMVGAKNTSRAWEKVLVNRHRLGDVSAGGAGIEKKAFCHGSAGGELVSALSD